jgi:O-antigen/teichoic acid export membrane protein
VTTLARRSITAVSWNALANAIGVVVLFVRAVILARLLPVEVFGIYAGASAVIGLTVIGATFGMGSAFLHRAPETEDEEQAARVHFTLKLLFVAGWSGIMVIGTLLLADGPTRTALLLLIGTTAGIQLAETPRLILVRRVVHRRLALIQVLNAVLTTVVAVTLAWRGATLWALLATDLATLVVILVSFFFWRPVWRPRLQWSVEVARYYLRFGSRTFLAGALQNALDRLDDVWTRLYLGATPLGFYSRAYSFAAFPRRLIAAPIDAVVGGTYAELKGDRERLSTVFFRTTALLVRIGFFAAGLLALVAPEFIRIVLGEKWMPMLYPFRLMLIFTMLDPLRTTVSSIFVAVGRPAIIARCRAAQFGITGVALAVTAMVTIGIGLLMWSAREFVSFSPVRLFGVPLLALMLAMFAARSAILMPGVLGADWRTGAVKVLVFVSAYTLIHWAFERGLMVRAVGEIRSLMSAGSGAGAAVEGAEARTGDPAS